MVFSRSTHFGFVVFRVLQSERHQIRIMKSAVAFDIYLSAHPGTCDTLLKEVVNAEALRCGGSVREPERPDAQYRASAIAMVLSTMRLPAELSPGLRVAEKDIP
jgi:hypothetical protein